MTRSSLPLVLVLLLATTLAPSACRGARVPDRPLEVVLVGHETLNGGNAAVVRFYALGSDASLEGALPEVFWQDDQAALGDALLGAPREVVLFPGSTETFDLVLDENTQFVGVAADLRDPGAGRWRAVVPIAAVRKAMLAVTVGENMLSAEPRNR